MKHETIVSPVVEALLKGRARIKVAWVQCTSFTSLIEGYCAMTALSDTECCLEALEAIRAVLPAGWASVPKYNDHPTTTKQDILALYDRAIAKALTE